MAPAPDRASVPAATDTGPDRFGLAAVRVSVPTPALVSVGFVAPYSCPTVVSGDDRVRFTSLRMVPAAFTWTGLATVPSASGWRVPPLSVTGPDPRLAPVLNWRVPAETTVPPAEVVVPVSRTVPVPSLMNAPLPVICPE